MFVFLSYSRADSDLVMRLKNDLLGHGVQVWIDREGLQPGTLDWEEALDNMSHMPPQQYFSVLCMR